MNETIFQVSDIIFCWLLSNLVVCSCCTVIVPMQGTGKFFIKIKVSRRLLVVFEGNQGGFPNLICRSQKVCGGRSCIFCKQKQGDRSFHSSVFVLKQKSYQISFHCSQGISLNLYYDTHQSLDYRALSSSSQSCLSMPYTLNEHS